jgi:hypothetical protein
MPLACADPDDIIMPFSKKVFLFRLLQVWHLQQLRRSDRSVQSMSSTESAEPTESWVAEATDKRASSLFTRPPVYKTFLAVLRRPEFNKLKFHRIVPMTRCPKCCLFRYMCLTAPTEQRAQWQALAAAHDYLQIAQKRAYAADRAIAASDYPLTELYMAMDGGSGSEFVFPHLAAESTELPSKALGTFHTVPLKVMNGLVHGDSRSHVILSPGTVFAGASHACEALMVLINTAFEEHANLPRRASVQLDNAATNHNMLVLAFSAIYVPGRTPQPAHPPHRLEASPIPMGHSPGASLVRGGEVLYDVFDEFRVRFELENHAHDIYDAFHAVHARAVKTTSFYHWDELVDIIEKSHVAARQRHERLEHGVRPLMGHRVMVTNLWQVRDLWDWLAPGYHDDKDAARSRAAYVTYDRLQGYRDFSLRPEPAESAGSAESRGFLRGRRVGLWAKPFMSDASYEYIGTITTQQLFEDVARKEPRKLGMSDSKQKRTREREVLRHLERLTRGDYQQQFTPQRMADAMALTRHDLGHFASCKGTVPPGSCRFWLPTQLAQLLRERGLRSSAASAASGRPYTSASAPTAVTDLSPSVRPPPMSQRLHVLRDIHHFTRASDVELVASAGSRPRIVEDFARAPVAVGCCVLTWAAPKSPLGRASNHLRGQRFWVWRIIRIFDPGATLPQNSRHVAAALEPTYEAHLYSPTSNSYSSPVRPCWDVVDERIFLRTPAEKAARAAKKAVRTRSRSPRHGPPPDADPIPLGRSIHTPLVAFLRPDNLVGGGFMLSASNRIPTVARSYADSQLQSMPH